MKTTLLLSALLGVGLSVEPAESARSTDCEYEAPAPGSYTLPVIKPAADGALFDTKGKAIRLRELVHGRVTVMSFIYTRCAAAKACPFATGVLLQLHRTSLEDPELAKELRLVSLSFDPVNDTPEHLAVYARVALRSPSAAPWHFVTAPSAAELQPILAAYGQAVDERQNPRDPAGPLNHTLRVFLIDREGRIRNIYSTGTLDPRLILADVRTLIRENARGR